MRLNNNTLVNSIENLNKLSQMKLPVKISYAIAKNISKVENELKIYNNQRQKLIEDYGEKNEDGKTKVSEDNQITIAKDYLEDWIKEYNELLSLEIDIDIHKIKVEDLANSNCEISPADLILIDYMLED